MGITIGSNLTSLRARRRLADASSSLAATFERLASGQRINKASDDAAGLSVVSALNTDRRVYAQGIRNLNDGLSALTITDAALDSLSTIIIRLEELAEQSANGVLGHRQRKSLNEEAQALSAEYFRIAQSTKFNDTKLLNGSMGELRVQVGYGGAGSIADGIGGAIGTGGFSSRTSFAAGDSPNSVAVGDLNGDGIVDMVTADFDSDTASVLLGKGDGTFGSRTVFAAGDRVFRVTLGDVNSDGMLDLVTADEGPDTVSVFLGNGNGTFGARRSYVTIDKPHCASLGDLNGDGFLDMVKADFGNNRASVLLGNGDGSFYDKGYMAAGLRPTCVALGDLNNDAILDLVVAEQFADSASIFLGKGDGTFSSRKSLATGSLPSWVALGDLNRDGALDMVTADSGAGKTSVFLGKGDGSFFPRRSFTAGSNVNFVALGDLNGDGILDMATSDWGSNTASILIGTGSGSFQSRRSFTTGTEPCAVALSDVNGDGVLDMISADRGSDTVSVYLARTQEGASPLLPFDLSTMAGARQALPVFQRKLAQLASQRGEVGAFQARLGSTVNLLYASNESIAAAAGRIMDADIAQESSSLVRTQILQQAGGSVLAQANLQPALALTLLAGI